ncbi:ribosomal protection-like ABC-F family protein [Alkalihalobacillus sp. AL-G]|uniref:ribosomal protection-like ABC-F family protein n=1 Tax=Alkalihalobacillus sp. AL-G TaxID=2926399 RepID=UPI00272B69A2|nr:ABC-F family ATP-binding cassette domain-containing protein [Alkalihalobacillus sp. AL-G]WLD94834.1 ATP-binding cassette domain-containing protein [Alkalihalobacillus sp. AL-G]
MIVCSINQISKMYAGTWIFQDITLQLHEKERVALIGTNGCGKSTLMKCIAGIEHVDAGTLSYKKDITIGMLDQIPNVTEPVTVEELLKQSFEEVYKVEMQLNQVTEKMGDPKEQHQLEKLYKHYASLQEKFEEMNGYAIESKINGVLQGLDLEQLRTHTFQSLSGGEQTKVGLAAILLEEPDLLLLDEPTNHLDMEALDWLEDYLNNYNGTVLVISHDRYFLDRITTSTVEIDSGAIEQCKGNYSNFVQEKEKRLMIEFQAYQDQQKKIKKMKEAIKRMRDWANRADNPKMHKRARNMERALERINKIDRPQLERKTAALEFQKAKRSGKDVIVVEAASKMIEDRILFSDINLLLQFQEKAAIIGKNGVGKSTLLRMILGEVPVEEGTVKLGASVKVGYLSQKGLVGYDDWTVVDAYRDVAEIEEGKARHRLSKFLFYGKEVFQKVKDLSGGERTRLRLAQIMAENVNFLILDEPTNHLDIDSREVLEEALEEFKGTMLVVSHDRYFLNKLIDRIFWIENEGLYSYIGNYEAVKQERLQQKA